VYASAFRKVLQHGPTTAPLVMTDAERAAFGHAERIRNALTIGTDTAGGFLVPFHLDPAVLLTSAGSVNPLRVIARVEPIATDTWNGVSSAGVTAEWLAEEAEAADAAPTLTQQLGRASWRARVWEGVGGGAGAVPPAARPAGRGREKPGRKTKHGRVVGALQAGAGFR
jgi:hypothetical protein